MQSLTMEQRRSDREEIGNNETPERFSSTSGRHQDHLYNQPYQAENASSSFNGDQHNHPNKIGLNERNYVNARHDHSFSIIVNHADQTNRFIQSDRSGKITRDSLTAENKKTLRLKKSKNVSKRKLLTIDKQTKKVLLSDGGSAKSLRIVNYTQSPNVTLPQQM